MRLHGRIERLGRPVGVPEIVEGSDLDREDQCAVGIPGHEGTIVPGVEQLAPEARREQKLRFDHRAGRCAADDTRAGYQLQARFQET